MAAEVESMLPGEFAHVSLELGGSTLGGVLIGNSREMIVSVVGVSSVEYGEIAGERLLIIPLDGLNSMAREDRPDPVRMGAEPAEISQAIDLLGPAGPGVPADRFQGQIVAVDAAAHGDSTGHRSLTSDR